MQRLMVMGLNHATAALEMRERVAFSAAQRRDALAAFHDRFADAEAVLLSTCNRVELYAARPVHGHPRLEEMVDFVAGFHGIGPRVLTPHVYHKDNRDAVAHLFAVAASLDSMVLGETQILGQVREAYEAACAVQSAGPTLNPLFQRAIAIGRQVMSQTSIADGRLSVASVAVDHARRIFEEFADKTVLSIGAGKMATLVLRHFSELSPRRLMICNRSADKARVLAAKFNSDAVPFEALEEHLVAADIVVSSTGAGHPIITRQKFDSLLKRRRYRPIFMIDIAVPRDIEPSVGELDHVYLYNIDDLQQVVAATRAQRQDAVDAARRIIDHEVDEFIAAQRTRELGPLIEKLYARYHGIAQEELARVINRLPAVSDAQRAQLEDLARRIVNKVLHEPVQRLRSTSESEGTQVPYLHAMEHLFNLAIEPKPGPETGEGERDQTGA